MGKGVGSECVGRLTGAASVIGCVGVPAQALIRKATHASRIGLMKDLGLIFRHLIIKI